MPDPLPLTLGPEVLLLRSLLLLSLAISTFASMLSADQVVMKNGDRVTGSIVKKDAAKLTIKSAHFGTVTLPWDQIESVKTEAPINVVLKDGKTVNTTLATTDGKIEVGAGDAKQTVAPADVVALRDAAEQKAYERLLKPRFADLWAVTGSIGWAGVRGNARTNTWTTALSAARVSNTSKTTAYFNAIRASALIKDPNTGGDISAKTAQAVRGGWGYSRNLNKRLFVNTFNDWEYDRFQSLDLRTVFGGGLGYMVWKGERGRLDLVGGAAWNREKFDPAPKPAFVRNSAEAYWGDDFTYKLSSRTNLIQGFRMFNNLSDTGKFRTNFDVGAVTQVFKWLSWNLSLSDRYLSNPVPGRLKNDFLYTTGFGFSFAR